MATPVARKTRKPVRGGAETAQATQAPPEPTAPAGPETPPPMPSSMIGTAAVMMGPDANAPMPPALDEAGLTAITVGWVYNRAITHLWSYDASTGVWVWVDGIGWKRLSPVSEFGHSHMTVLATVATDRNLAVDYHEDAAGQIDQLLV